MLANFIENTRSERFKWGKNDCALWCASAVDACTGYDPAGDLRGTYDSWFGCRRAIMQAGGLEALIAPRMARFAPLDGDGVAIVRVCQQQLCALIVAGRAVAKTESGILMRDNFDLVRGWSW